MTITSDSNIMTILKLLKRKATNANFLQPHSFMGETIITNSNTSFVLSKKVLIVSSGRH